MTDTVTMSTTLGTTVPTMVSTTDTPAWTPPTWEEIVAQHSGRVYRLAYRLTGNPHDAEDLTHDVFIRVFRSLHSYQPGTFEGWLHRITTNVFLDEFGISDLKDLPGLSELKATGLLDTRPAIDTIPGAADLFGANENKQASAEEDESEEKQADAEDGYIPPETADEEAFPGC